MKEYSFKFLKLKILFLLLSSSIYSVAQSENFTEGTEFWMGFLLNGRGTGKSVIAITSKSETDGKIEIPASGWSQNFTVPNGGSIEIELPTNLTQAKSTGIFPFGVKITSDNVVNVFAINRTGGSDDATMVSPLGTLGYEYYLGSWLLEHGSPPEFNIISTSDKTAVEITTPAGSSKIITLNRGEIYHSNDLLNDVSGTRIKSVCGEDGLIHPIAVFSGHQFAAVINGTSDHLFSQMYPVEGWGKSFNLVPLPYANDYFITIIGSENGTLVKVDNVEHKLEKGKFLRLNQIGYGYISSNKPISVQMYTRGRKFLTGSSDPLMINLSPDNLGLTGTRFYSFGHPEFITEYPQYVQVLTKTSNTGNIKLDGTNVANWNINPKNPAYSSALINLPKENTDHTIKSTNDPFIAYVSAQQHARSFGYCIGHNIPFEKSLLEIGYVGDTTEYEIFEDTVCSCEPVWFKASHPYSAAIYSWEFNDGSGISIGNPVTHTFPNGEFDVLVKVLNEDGCIIDTLLMEELIVINCDIEMNPLAPICLGESVTLTSVSGHSFLWSTGETAASITVSPATTTSYSLEVNGGLLSICEDIIVYVNTPKTPQLIDSLAICSNETVLLNPNVNGSHIWSNGEKTPTITVNKSEEYSVMVLDDNNCTIYDTTTIFVQEISKWTLNEDTAIICKGNSLEIYPDGDLKGMETYSWSTGDKTESITVNKGGIYTLNIFDNICESSHSTLVNVTTPWKSAIKDSITVCDKSHVIDVEQPFTTYFWSTGETTPKIKVSESGFYSVETRNECGNSGATVEVVFDCGYALYIPNSFTPNDDSHNNVFLAEGVKISEYEMIIYNRWGELIFESNNINEGWDGTQPDGTETKTGTYVYKALVLDIYGEYHSYYGHVSLLR